MPASHVLACSIEPCSNFLTTYAYIHVGGHITTFGQTNTLYYNGSQAQALYWKPPGHAMRSGLCTSSLCRDQVIIHGRISSILIGIVFCSLDFNKPIVLLGSSRLIFCVSAILAVGLVS